jgi:WD40 repeat protein
LAAAEKLRMEQQERKRQAAAEKVRRKRLAVADKLRVEQQERKRQAAAEKARLEQTENRRVEEEGSRAARSSVFTFVSPAFRKTALAVGGIAVLALLLYWATRPKPLLTLKGHTSLVRSVAWSPDGQRLATASDDDTAKVWDAASGQELLTLRGNSKGMSSVAWSPPQTGKDERLATGSYDNTAKVWDAASGKELLTLRGHTNSVYSVAWSPDGQRLATASRDHTAKVWEAASGR